ncbi:accessory Sec system protein Asp2 [Staphylococcus aureus]
MTVKIATIGSCITRDNFNTKFNPNYKRYFDVVAHQNQTTLPSLMSSKLELNVNQSFLEKSPYVQGLLYKEYSKEFLSILKEKTPDYLLIDLDPDVKFGLLKLDDNQYVTANPNFKDLPQLNNLQYLNIIDNYDIYINIWKEAVAKFFEFMSIEVPNCKVILVKARFSDTFTDGTSLTKMREEKGVSLQKFRKMNEVWNVLDEYITNKYNVSVLDMAGSQYLLNKNHLWGPYYLHYEDKFYNAFLNKLIKMVENDKGKDVILKEGNRTIQRIYLDDNYEILNTKVVEVILNSEKNIIELARENKYAYDLYKDLLANDYILYFHNEGISKLYKRNYVKELWKRNDLIQQGGVFYTLDVPKDKKLNKSKNNKKLLIIFTCMPATDVYDNYLMTDRMFPKFFNGIERSLMKNVYTMRIMDLNCSHGSHYINTTNNKNMENDISNAIHRVKDELGIEKVDIVLYGASEGGTGSLYYGSKLDLKCLAIDPIISLGEYNVKDDHFLKGLRKEDISDDINFNLSKQNEKEKYIIGSENVPFNFSMIAKIHGKNINKINMVDEHIKSHPDVSRNSIPEQLMLLNKMLLNKI